MSELICVGAIAGAFGVKGEVRLKSFTSIPEAIADYAPLLTEKGEKKFDVVITGEIKNGLSARMSGVISKEEADKLKGTRLYVPRERLPQLPEDEYYHTDLIGLIVQNLEGSNIGRIKSVLNHGASDLLEIENKHENKSFLVPFTQEIVPKVDIKKSIVIIDPPKGLFE
tara:strand:+ start:109 stop:615 length:507 start_codon:yes stop_codon:yes gene_type:complete